jgi:histone acetyltransferase (RNA polymerase elongator complex component)
MEGKRLIIPIFISHFGCPHKCLYCDQHKIARHTPTLPSPEEIYEEIELNLRACQSKKKAARLVQVAFYGGSFTGLPLETQNDLLCSVAPFIKEGKVHSIRLSTRPDYIYHEVLKTLKAQKVATVELGVQSMDNGVLKITKRGYGRNKVIRAVMELHQRGFEVGIQLMVGLPGDTPEKFASTIEDVIKMRPHFVRIYPTLVIKGTLLERWYQDGRYRPVPLQEAITITKGALERFRHARIAVIRVGLQPTPYLEKKGTIVAGPYHPAFRQLVESSILYEQAVSLLMEAHRDSFVFVVSPLDISNFYGHGGQNIKRLKEIFRLEQIRVEADPQKERGMVSLRG